MNRLVRYISSTLRPHHRTFPSPVCWRGWWVSWGRWLFSTFLLYETNKLVANAFGTLPVESSPLITRRYMAEEEDIPRVPSAHCKTSRLGVLFWHECSEAPFSSTWKAIWSISHERVRVLPFVTSTFCWRREVPPPDRSAAKCLPLVRTLIIKFILNTVC